MFFHYILLNWIPFTMLYALQQIKDPVKYWGGAIFGFLAALHPVICCWNGQILTDNVKLVFFSIIL